MGGWVERFRWWKKDQAEVRVAYGQSLCSACSVVVGGFRRYAGWIFRYLTI